MSISSATAGPPVVLHVSRWNPGGRRRVLLVHGLASSSGTWWRVASEMADADCEVVAPDLRGHGRSPTTVRYDFDADATDLGALGGPWDLAVGHSLAGPILARLARTGTVARLLLLDPVFSIDDDEFESVLADQVAEVGPQVTADVVRAANPTWSAQDATQKAHDAQATSPSVVEWSLRHNHPYDHLADLAATDVPTLVLGADPVHGTMCPAHTIEAIDRSNIRHRTVPGAGHGIHRECPDVVVGATLECLATD